MDAKPPVDHEPAPDVDPAAWRRGLQFTDEFHMHRSSVHRALTRLARRLDETGIAYAVAGGMALNGHGYERATVAIDVLVTADGLRAFKDAHLGRGYVEQFAGSRGVRDTEERVPIDFLVAGEFPGDGLPKDVAFPDPGTTAVNVDGVRILTLPRLVELKLASGLSAPHRLRDLGDVLELIRVRSLKAEFAEQLAPSVREKYGELWTAAQGAPRDD